MIEDEIKKRFKKRPRKSTMLMRLDEFAFREVTRLAQKCKVSRPKVTLFLIEEALKNADFLLKGKFKDE